MIKVRTKEDLENLIEKTIKECGYDCDLNFIDTYEIMDMSCLFYNSPFNGDISKWNVNNVIDMSHMFYGSKFNGNISNWDVSNVIDMYDMFTYSSFNRDISNWNIDNVRLYKNKNFLKKFIKNK